ncbi:MAG: hypothetical protein JSU70_11765 [Phycisphaerales bacterium]|nr:MAG: hypothetical protein JSU70_11765 [Phycisphaerales bacterium]
MRRTLTRVESAIHGRNTPNGRCRTHNRSSGVTLTEVMVASGLLVIALIPILKALGTATHTAVIVERKTRSLALAQAKLEEIKARSVYHYDDSFTENSTSLGGSYLCKANDDQGPDLRTISVSVGYDLNGDNDLAAGEVELTLTTYVARRWPGP